MSEIVINGGSGLLSTPAVRVGLVLPDPFGRGRHRGTPEYTLMASGYLSDQSLLSDCDGTSSASRAFHSYGELVLGEVLSTSNIPPGNTLNINFTITSGWVSRFSLTATRYAPQGSTIPTFPTAIWRQQSRPQRYWVIVEYHWLRPK